MNNQNQGERSFIRLLAAWAVFGTRMVARQEIGVLFTDLHKDNFGIRPGSDDILIIDLGGAHKIKYPEDWYLIPTVLLSLLQWLNEEQAAAFRFGYITQGNPVSKLVFDTLRAQYDFHAFVDCPDILYTPRIEIEAKFLENLNEICHQWQTLRGVLKIGDKVDRDPNLGDLGQWRGERRRRAIVTPSDADEFYYKKHLIAAAYHSSIRHTFEALLNLQGFYEVTGRQLHATGIARYCQHLASHFVERISDELRTQIELINKSELNQLPDQLSNQLNLIPDFSNIFRYLWALDDCVMGTLATTDEITNLN